MGNNNAENIYQEYGLYVSLQPQTCAASKDCAFHVARRMFEVF